jgi:hypothetical protein
MVKVHKLKIIPFQSIPLMRFSILFISSTYVFGNVFHDTIHVAMRFVVNWEGIPVLELVWKHHFRKGFQFSQRK